MLAAGGESGFVHGLLLIAQRDQRIDTHCAPCGDHRRGEAGGGERESHGGECQRVSRLDLEELCGQQTASQKRGADSCRHARGHQDAGVTQDDAEDMSAPAPSAMRMPISWVACVTEYEITP